MASFANQTQQKAEVDALGYNEYHEERGHNTLSVDVSGSNLNQAWLEISLNGGAFEEMRRWDQSVFEYPLTNAADQTVLSGVSIREAFSTHWEDSTRSRTILVFGENNSGSGQDLWWAEGTDFTDWTNAQEILNTSTKTEDPCVFEVDGSYYVLTEEEGGVVSQAHGNIAYRTANSRTIQSLSGVQQNYGGEGGGVIKRVASPNMWRWNDRYYITGEEHDTADKDMYCLIGETDPWRWEREKIVARVADYSAVSKHINLQALYIDKYGTLHGYSNQSQSSTGTFATRYMGTDTLANGAEYPQEPWTMSTASTADNTNRYNIGCIQRTFNNILVMANDMDDLTYIDMWDLKSVASTETISVTGGDTVSFEFYEPSLFPGDTIEWRIAVENSDGTVDRSTMMTFDIVDGTPGGAYVDGHTSWEAGTNSKTNTYYDALNLGIADDFEDGAVPSRYASPPSGTLSTSTTYSADEVTSLEWSGKTNSYMMTPMGNAIEHEVDGVAGWVRTALTSDRDSVGLALYGDASGATFQDSNWRGYFVDINASNGWLRILRADWTNGNTELTRETFSAVSGETFYYLLLYKDSSDVVHAEVYDEGMNQLVTSTVTDTTYTSGYPQLWCSGGGNSHYYDSIQLLTTDGTWDGALHDMGDATVSDDIGSFIVSSSVPSGETAEVKVQAYDGSGALLNETAWISLSGGSDEAITEAEGLTGNQFGVDFHLTGDIANDSPVSVMSYQLETASGTVGSVLSTSSGVLQSTGNRTLQTQ